MKPLNIALIRQRYTADGGAERYTERDLNSLRPHGARITLNPRAWRSVDPANTHTCNQFFNGNLRPGEGLWRVVCFQAI